MHRMVEIRPDTAVQVLPRVHDSAARVRRPPRRGQRVGVRGQPLVVPPRGLVDGDADGLGVHVRVGGPQLYALMGGEGASELLALTGVFDRAGE